MPNSGPSGSEPGAEAGESSRRRNPSSVHRDSEITDDLTAASVRAQAVTARFGGPRYALARPDQPEEDVPPSGSNDSEVPD
ncbi:hypothetical protein [Actinoplanes sp. HUAS TT8]|uniref:hypothetical protein n=1 Tax=Actinoplanes sp. HUAS TT8 TaxID=3447453 RepID=UPI003F51C040